MKLRVEDLPADVIFISDSQDVAAVKRHVGSKADEYESFFVRVAGGDYHAVYGMNGIVPLLYKSVKQIL